MSSRSDRILIAVALLILLLTLGGLFSYDTLFGNASSRRISSNDIGQITVVDGDTRVKYSGDLAWKPSNRGQKLQLNDAIFAGKNSRIEIAIGGSHLTLEPNTMIVLRKTERFSALALTFGSLSARLNKDDLVIETQDGKRIQLHANSPALIAITGRRNDETKIKVVEGSAKVTQNNHAQDLAVRDEIKIAPHIPKFDPIVFSAPMLNVRYGNKGREFMRFAWHYNSARAITPDDRFTFEAASDNTFQHLILREAVRGVDEISPSIENPQEVYYRVKDGAGNFSEVRRILLDVTQIPTILAPNNGDVVDTQMGQKTEVEFSLPVAQNDAKISLQISNNADFQKLIESKSINDGHAKISLPPGDFFVRARAEYRQLALDGNNLVTDWSPVNAFSVREKVDADRMARMHPAVRLTIPNREYPAQTYASDEAARAIVAQQNDFSQFFAPMQVPGHDIFVIGEREQRAGKSFPSEWIRPGTQSFQYEYRSHGAVTSARQMHSVRIDMEAPKDLRARGSNISWSPILFAKNYEVDLQNQYGLLPRAKYAKARADLKLEKGMGYRFRVRALNAKSEAISNWSESKDFEVPLPMAAPTVPLAQEEPEETKRAPAQALASEEPAATSSMKISEVMQKAWAGVNAWLWVGTGMNFLDVKQTVSDKADVNYRNSKGPSAYAEAGWLSKSRWGGIFSYKRTPGDIKIDNLKVDNSEFTWNTYSLEAIYGWGSNLRLFQKPINWGLRAGIQNHSFPFLYITSGQNVSTAQNQMRTASVGLFAETEGRWQQHILMRYQQPFSSSTEGGNKFSVEPIIAFDGSLGTTYRLSERLKTGMFWYGQYHNYNFKYATPTATNSGSQSLFYSNLELRLGLDF